MIRYFVLFFLLSGMVLPLAAQVPTTNVYVFKLTQKSDTIITLSEPQYLTAFNADGYNNQPHWFSNNVLYLSVQEPGQSQPDIYSLDIKRKLRTRITDTPSGEYSPQRMPDYYNFSAIRQEMVGRDTVLRLWQFPVDRFSNGRPIFRYNGMGYYHWINTYMVVLFMVENPSKLVIADINSDHTELVAENVGRTFFQMPNGNLIYLQKTDVGPWQIMEKNLYRRSSEPKFVASGLGRIEDFIALSDGTLLMGYGSKIYRFHPSRDEEWTEIVDLLTYDITDISRMAISGGGHLAIVSN